MECGQETWESAEQSGEQDQNDDGNIRPRTRMAANKEAVESGREGRGSRVSVHGQELMGSQKNEFSTEAASAAGEAARRGTNKAPRWRDEHTEGRENTCSGKEHTSDGGDTAAWHRALKRDAR